MTLTIKVSVPNQTTDNVIQLLKEHAVAAQDCYWDDRRVFATVLSVPDLVRFAAIHRLKDKRVEANENVYWYKFRSCSADRAPELFQLQFDIEELTRRRIQEQLVIMGDTAYVVFDDERIPDMLKLNRALDELNTERGDLLHGLHVENSAQMLAEWRRIPADGLERYYCDRKINNLIDHRQNQQKTTCTKYTFNDADFDLGDPIFQGEEQLPEQKPANFDELAKPVARYTQDDIQRDIQGMVEAIDKDLEQFEFAEFVNSAAKREKREQSAGEEFGALDGPGWF